MGTKAKLRFGITLLAFQTLFIILFGAFVRYDGPAAPPPATRSSASGSANVTVNATSADANGEEHMVEMPHQDGSEQNLHSLYPSTYTNGLPIEGWESRAYYLKNKNKSYFSVGEELCY